jgi:hypothetical protein
LVVVHVPQPRKGVLAVGRYYGLDTSGSAFNLAAWESDDPEIVRERLGRTSTTAEEIIDVLESEFTHGQTTRCQGLYRVV